MFSFQMTLQLQETLLLEKKVQINFENVLNASKLANIHDHIMNLPNEYSTYLGKAGSSLGSQTENCNCKSFI